MAKVSVKINGNKISKEVSDNTLLSDFLRDKLALTGTHIGCDTSQCGACVVHFNGNSVKICTTLVADCDGGEITTIEGLASNGKMHPMQEAFKKHHGLQCGFCTPGMIMSAVDLLQKNKNPSEQDIRDWLEGNICRCTGYQGIVAAVKDAAAKM
jgi:carbon-monoxide dehydrogenase small subunit